MTADRIDAVRRSLENASIIFRALFRWFTPSAYVATKVVMPLEQLTVFALLGRYAGGDDRVAYIVVGNCVVLAAIGGLAAAATVGEERSQATLPLLIASPASRLVNFLERGLLHVVDSIVTVAFALAAAALVFGVDFSRLEVAAFAAAIGTAIVSSIALGLLLGALALGWAEFFLVSNGMYLVLLALAGVNFPVAELPGWLQPVSAALPFTRSIESARDALAGAPLGDVASPLLGELALGGGYFVLGYALLRAMEAVALRRGSLELT